MVALHPAVPSERKIEANRTNSRRSTGPRTSEGKLRSSRNAVTHGVYCRDLVLPGESQPEFDALRDGVVADLRPRGAAEALVAEQFVAAAWKLRRVRAAEREMYLRHARAEHKKEFEAAVAKQKQWEEYVWRCSTPKKPVQGPPPPPPPLFDPEKTPAGASLAAIVAGDGYDKLAKLEERLERTLHRCLRELRLLRKDAAEWDEQDEPVTEAVAAPNEQNEPTEPPADVRESAVSNVIMRNEATGGAADIAAVVVATPPAHPEVAPVTSGGA